MTEGQRINELVKSMCGGNQARFSRETGIEKTILNKLVKDSGAPSGIRLTDTYIRRIVKAYPVINEAWLRTGTGDPGDISPAIIKARYMTLLAERDAQIQELKADNIRLKKALDKLLK